MKQLAIFLSLAFGLTARANSTSKILIPDLDRTVRYEQDSSTKEYAIDYRDLIDVKLLSSSAPIDQHTCKDWKQAAKVGRSSVGASAFQEGKWSFKVQVLQLNQAAIAKAFNHDWSNVGNFETAGAKLEVIWTTSSSTSSAGPQLNYEVNKELNASLNSLANRQSLNSSGTAEVTTSYPIFACDLVGGNASLKLTFDAVQYGSFHSASVLKADDLVTISHRVTDSVAVITGAKSNTLNNEAAQIVNAAGLLAFELKRQGYSPALIQSGDFLRLFDRIYDAGVARPAVLSNSQAETLVNSSQQTRYEPSPIHIEESLSF